MLEKEFLASYSGLSRKRVSGGVLGPDFDLQPLGICMGLMVSDG